MEAQLAKALLMLQIRLYLQGLLHGLFTKTKVVNLPK